MKSQPQSLFSSKKFSENAVKIILKKSKTKSRVILIFFFWGGGDFFRSFCCRVNNSIEHNYESEQANKTSGKNLFREQNKANKVLTESLYFKLFFAY